MVCPKCGKEKLTANPKRNIAQCWACREKWYPSKKHAYKVSWGCTIIRWLAAQSQKHLTEENPCTLWFRDKRKIEFGSDWLIHHSVGSWPPGLDTTRIVARAREVLEEDHNKALTLADGDKDVAAVEALFKSEKETLEEFVKEKLSKLKDPMWNNAAVFIYTNGHGDPISLNIRQFALETDKKKWCFRLQPILGRRGVFNPVLWNGEFWGDKVPVYCVEGEVNHLQLQAQTKRWLERELKKDYPTGYDYMNDMDNEKYLLGGMAMGGKEGSDIKSMAQLLNREAPLVIHDNDDIDLDTGKQRGYSLVEWVNWKTPCHIVTTPEKDVDDWIKARNPSPEDFLALVEDAEYSPRPYEALKEGLDKKLPDRASRLAMREATEMVWDDLLMRGRALNASCGLILIESEEENEVVQVRSGHPSWLRLMHRYGIEASVGHCDGLGKNIGVRSTAPGIPKTELHVLSHYDRESKCLYVDELDRVLRINADGSVTVLRNGDDGVIFTPAGDERHAELGLKIGLAEGSGMRVQEGGVLDKHILDMVRWDTGKDGISAVTAKQLYKVHLISIFFDTLVQGKICPVFDGPAGGGKNAVTQMTGMLFEGKDFNINPMPTKEAELDEKTVDRIYAGFDEYESGDRDMERAFRSWCTRGYAERRELYTTWGKATRPLARGMGLSTNQNPARDLATGQRQLMFSVKPRQDAVTDAKYLGMKASLEPAFLSKRNEIWTELIEDLRSIVRSLAQGNLNTRTTFRMADFAVLLLVCADAEGWGPEARNMLQSMAGKQTAEMADKNLGISLLRDWLLKNPIEEGAWKTQGEWQAALVDVVPANDRKARERLTSDYMKWLLTGQGVPMLKSAFRMQQEFSGHKKQFRFRFFSISEKAGDPLQTDESGSGGSESHTLLPSVTGETGAGSGSGVSDRASDPLIGALETIETTIG